MEQNKSTDLIKNWDKINKMRNYLSSKDFSIKFTILLLPIKKCVLNFFLKKNA